jgi:NodT family efflux transporter outer membrane factor (OMF) lipoprotein
MRERPLGRKVNADMLVDNPPREPMTTRRPRPAGAAWLLGVLLAVSGCMVGPDFKTPEAPLQPKWRASDDPRLAAQTAADTQWWKGFKDPALDRLIDLAYQQNMTLEVAGLRIVEARARLGIASGRFWPQQQNITAGGAAVGVNEAIASGTDLDRNFFAYQVGFDAAWELDFWGKYRRGIESESSAVLGTVADYYNALVSLTAEVARTYAMIRTYEVLVDQARTNVMLQEESLRIADVRFKAGATSELDVTQATVLLESTRASIPQLEIGVQQGRNAMSLLLGQPIGTYDELLAGPKEIPKAPEQVAVSLPAEMLRRRPDIRSAELYTAAQCARIGVAKAELLPSFSIFGSIGLNGQSSGAGSSELFSSDALVYSVGPKISFPFFNYGRLTNNVRVQDARLQQLIVGYRNTVLKAAQEVEDSLIGFLNSKVAQTSIESSVTAAVRSEELAKVQYREGAADYQRVLEAQRSLLQQQNNLAQSRSSVTTNMIALYKALGGGWETRQGPFVSQASKKEMEERTDWSDLLTEPSSPEEQKNSTPAKSQPPTKP